MAEVTLRLRRDPQTGKKSVVIYYSSDSDALPMEHEADHKRVVDQLIEAGALDEDDRDSIVIERLPEESAPEAEVSSEGTTEREALDESS
ncbi:MAG: hypothetical protein AAF602_22350 [Myxococcota bacterium]